MSVPLPPRPTEASATKAIGFRVFDRFDEHQDAFIYARSWSDRMALIEPWFAEIIQGGANTDHVALWLTAFLEQLGERSIDTLDQAILYRAGLNTSWHAAATEFFADEPDPLALSFTYPAVTTFLLDRCGLEILRRGGH